MPVSTSKAFTRWRLYWMWWQSSNCSRLLIYRPWDDERLSLPGSLTYSGRLTHISGHPSATGRAQDGERTLARDWRSTAEPRGPTAYEHCNTAAAIGTAMSSQQECFWERNVCWFNGWVACWSSGYDVYSRLSVAGWVLGHSKQLFHLFCLAPLIEEIEIEIESAMIWSAFENRLRAGLV